MSASQGPHWWCHYNTREKAGFSGSDKAGVIFEFLKNLFGNNCRFLGKIVWTGPVFFRPVSPNAMVLSYINYSVMRKAGNRHRCDAGVEVRAILSNT